MKRFLFIVFAVFTMAACQPDSNGGGGGQIATTPLDMNCINGTTYCNNSAYQNYAGFMPYPNMYMYGYNYNYANMFMQQGLCNCPNGWSPVYNGTMGLGCVQNYYIQPWVNSYFSWSFGVSQTGWGWAAPQAPNNWAQQSNIPNAANSLNSCSRTATHSCVIGQANNCSSGQVCRQILASSSLGICTQ